MKSNASWTVTGFFSVCLYKQKGLTYTRYRFSRLLDDRNGVSYLIVLCMISCDHSLCPSPAMIE
jgi:hypothetical protein